MRLNNARLPDGGPFFVFQQDTVCLLHQSVSLFGSLVMYILHQGVYQSAQDKTFCVPARAMKECGATVTKCVVMAKEEEREQTDVCFF